jgi:outer membrane protein
MLLVLSPGVVWADTLFDAIQMAYETNPTLQSQQAKLRATDEEVVQARSGYGPQVNFSGQATDQTAHVNLPAGPFTPATTQTLNSATGQAQLTAAQPLFTNGAVHAQVESARADVGAGRQDLRETEAQLVLNVITAYEDVRRDRQILAVLREEIGDIDGEYQETQARTNLGDLTKTDLAQAEARLVAAQSQLALTSGQLDTSAAEYVNVVGQSPGELQPEPDLPGVPANADQAFDAAEHESPILLGAMQAERAADAKIRAARASFGPNVSLQASAGLAPYETYTPNSYIYGVTVGVVVTQSIFTSGLNSSKVQQAIELDNSAELDVDSARRNVVQLVAKAWDQYISTQNALALQQKQVDLETVAAEGYRVEAKAGMRSTVDLLNAELELASTRIAFLQSRHDEYIAEATLLAAMGRLEARYLLPNAPLYDPTVSAKHVANRYAVPWEGANDAIDAILYPPGAPPAPAVPATAADVHPQVSGAQVVGQ